MELRKILVNVTGPAKNATAAVLNSTNATAISPAVGGTVVPSPQPSAGILGQLERGAVG